MGLSLTSEFIFVGRGDESFLENYSYELSEDDGRGGKIFMALEILNNQAEAEDIGETIFANPSQTVTITVKQSAAQPQTDKPSETFQNSIVIEWNPPPEISKKASGYIIKIFDKQKGETKDIAVSKENHKLIVEKIAEGLYRITIFANIDGKLVQVGEPVEIEVKLKETINPFSAPRIAIAILLVLAGVFAIILIMRKFRPRNALGITRKSSS